MLGTCPKFLHLLSFYFYISYDFDPLANLNLPFPLCSQDGERGYLEGLASRYADLFNTHYRDVLVHLEDLRRREWAELSPRIKILGGAQTPTTPPGPAPNSPSRAFPNSHLPTSQSQPIYVPGKYSVSICQK